MRTMKQLDEIEYFGEILRSWQWQHVILRHECATLLPEFHQLYREFIKIIRLGYEKFLMYFSK